jgi:hypothetical protein
MSRLPGRSPLPSVTFAHVAARGSSRTIDRSAHLHLRSDERDPPDLGADCRRVPVLATRFLGRVSSHGVVQRSPLHRPSRGVRFPGRLGRAFPLRLVRPSGWEAIPIREPSSWFLTTSTVSPPRPCDHFQAAADPGVHRVSFRLRDGIPRDAPTALRSFPSADSGMGAKTNLRIRAGSRHWLDRLRSLRSPRSLAPSSLPSSRPLAVSRRAPR